MIVEDELLVARDLRETLEDLGYTVVASVANGEDAVATARALYPTAILMDIRLAGAMDGIQAATRIRAECDIPIVFLTAHSSDETLRRATLTDPFGYLVKPFRAAELRCAIEVAIRKHGVMHRLQRRERWLDTTLRSIGDGVVTTDTENRINYLNPVAEALTGWKRDDALGRTLDEILQLVEPRDRGRVAEHDAPDAPDAPATRGDAVLVSRDGSLVAIDDSTAPIVNDAGERLGGVMVLRDVSGRRTSDDEIRRRNADLERRIEERTGELEAAYDELEAFSYSVDHDLRTPLRGIEGFSQILIEDHASKLDAEGLDHLVTVRQAAQRMRALIDDLLRLSRAGRSELRRTTVSLSTLARQVVDRLRAAHLERDVIIEIDDALTVEGDRGLLEVVLENLIGNAWKFTSRRARATIRVGREPQGGGDVWFVRDDGAGFDAASAPRLFEAFQRFHASSEFDGTGLGLAIVQRIVQRHGGRVWVDSAVDAGTTVYFTL
jgi:PAS domain S-box-containing protein